MSNKEILEKALQKAIDGGWDGGRLRPFPLNLNKWRFDSDYDAFSIGQYEYEICVEPCEYIFDHNFAKALWGSKKYARPFLIDAHAIVDCICPTMKTQKNYEYHLQQMVIADDPIKYLGENI